MSDISIDETIKSFKLVNAFDEQKEQIYVRHELNVNKIENLEDCKKILKFLCDLSIKPLPNGIEYGGFGEVENYFD